MGEWLFGRHWDISPAGFAFVWVAGFWIGFWVKGKR